MLRFILTAMLTLILARFVFWVGRLLISGGRSAGGSTGAGRSKDAARRSERRSAWGRPRARVDRSAAIDVPFTEIPPAGRSATDAPEAAPDADGPSRTQSHVKER